MKPVRLLLILPLLAGAGGALLLCGCDSAAQPAPRAALPPVRQAAVAPAPRAEPRLVAKLPAIATHAAEGAVTNVFAATSWQPPPAPAPAPPPAAAPSLAPVTPPPSAPPMPFRFIGRYGDADSQFVMLVRDDKLYLVAVGETIDNAYRIERVSGTTVEMTYLPLKLKQSLSTGDAG